MATTQKNKKEVNMKNQKGEIARRSIYGYYW
jgi:hypothetical protein